MFDIVKNGIRFTVDPTAHYRQLDGNDKAAFERCSQGCGVLASFMFGPNEAISDNMAETYVFHSGWTPAEGDQATVDSRGVFHYPQDPALHPYLKAQRIKENLEPEGEVVYIYPYAQVCVVNDGKLVKRTRMD